MQTSKRNTILRLYDYVARHVTLDCRTDPPGITGCDDTLRNTIAWLHMNDYDTTEWLGWLEARGALCDCELLLNINTMAFEDGSTLGLNMRRCQSCNALLALYEVVQDESAEAAELAAWAVEAGVPAYRVVLSNANQPAPAYVCKIWPPGSAFRLTTDQFYRSVLGGLQQQHICLPNSAS
jgi:hypothetical protein